MLCGGVSVLNVQCFADFLEELQRRLLTIIRDEVDGWFLLKAPVVDKALGGID